MSWCTSLKWLVILGLITCWSYPVSSDKVVRHFYYHVDDSTYYKEHNITISTTSYLIQRLISEIMKQLLSTELGYDSVTYASGDLSLAFNYTSYPSTCSLNITFSSDTTILPLYSDIDNEELTSDSPISNETCIQLELPPDPLIAIHPSTAPVHAHYTDAGALGLSTRYGLYISSWAVSQLWSDHQVNAHYYSALNNSSLIDMFSPHNQAIIQAAEGKLDQGYSPGACTSNKCSPILLVGNHDIPEAQFESHIASLGVQLSIVYVQQNLTSLVHMLSESKVPVLFFSRAPDILTLQHTFTQIRSESGKCTTLDCDCHFPVSELRKTIWTKLTKIEPLIYEFIKNVHIDEKSILHMLEDFSKQYTSVATDDNVRDFIHQHWLPKNSAMVKRWIPAGASEKPELIIGGLFPTWQYSGWRDVTVSIAAQMAIELVNADSNVLKNYTLKLLVNDSRCDSAYVLKTFTEYISDDNIWPRMVGAIGPACDDTAIDIAGLARHYYYVMVSYAAGTMVLSLDRYRYNFFYRTVPQIDEYALVYVELIKDNGWEQSKVSMLTDDSSGEFPVYHRWMNEKFKAEGITIAIRELLPKKQYLKSTPEAYNKYLLMIKNADSYIIIMDVWEDVARIIMCEAYKLDMSPKDGYIWILPHHYRWNWYNYDQESVEKDNDGFACKIDNMTAAVMGYITLSHINIDKTGAEAVGGMTGTKFRDAYSLRVQQAQNQTDYNQYESEYGSYAYDAVWVFAKALNSLHDKNPAFIKYLHTPHAAQEYNREVNATTFQGVSGVISFNKQGHRAGTIIIRRYNISTRFLGAEPFLEPTIIGNWTNNKLTLFETIVWGPKKLPPTTPATTEKCEWEKLKVALGFTSCGAALLVVVIPSCILVIIVIIGGALCALRAAKKKYRLAAELASNFGHGRAFLNLDGKEIMRDHVVLNRKLGEGAFGTVYGGEAYINSVWTGVAVKTLKVGSNSEEKLDFLREADIMKRFEHKNIVRLLGVTTRGEPAYAIMEFMLYGDLKTYLLSRRELVGLDTKEADDISAASLTKMALDVVEGLNYLHSKEYIHRDIACRNCLVSASRIVKIGDFGMTRRVYDEGSYVFTRRGRLPVRWMAPESFVDGVFTYKTDMWSYGVLLYEIITFGSIPYHMLSNAEVFEGVKAGKTLTLPEECTDELKSLLLGCFNSDPVQRPTPVDIYKILTNNENTLQPLLSCPALAKIRECDSVELDLSPTFLKNTTLLKKPFLRQSSSVISVDTGLATLSRHRNHSEISYRRSTSHRRRSSHSIIDLFSLVNPGHPSPATPMSMPSPSHSTDQAPNFHFPSPDNRHMCPEPTCCEVRIPSLGRTQHNSGSATTSLQPVIAENDYLLTTRSCTDIDDRSNNSHTPLIQTGETAI